MLTLRPYQRIGRDWLAARTRALLADEMRVGKTPQAILAAEHIGAERVTVVCPAIAVPYWCGKWAEWAPDSCIELEVMSYDRARLTAEQSLAQTRDVLIVDECHFAKNPRAQRTQLIYGKGGIGYGSRYIWALSGTPAPKHAGELWPLLRAFGGTDLSYDDFTARYCTRWWHRQRREWVVKGTRQDRIPELKEILAPYMLRRTRAEVAPDMPAIGFNTLTIAQAGPDLHVPAGLSDEALAEWLEAHPHVDSERRQAVAHAKAEVLVEEIAFAVQNSLLAQTVVFGWHVEPLQFLAWQLNQRGVYAETITGATSAKQREHIQARFQRGETQVVVANILAAGTAIDLSAASHGYFLELDWVPGNNVQAANRLVSLQKATPVTFDVVTSPGTIDDRVQQVLTRRVREINQLI